MSRSTTESHPTFTEHTWELQGRITRESAPRSWEPLHDLAVLAHEATRDVCRLTFEDWRALVDAAANGLPVYITHEHPNVPTTGTTERTTRAYVVEHVEPNPRVYNAVRARCWGFTSNLALSQLVSVTVPEATYDYVREA